MRPFTISTINSRLMFFLLYWGFAALNCAFIIYAWQKWYLTSDNMIELMLQVGSVYLTPVGIVTAGLFTGNPEDTGTARLNLLFAGLFLVCFWNALVTYPFAYLVLKAGPEGMGPVAWTGDYWKASAALFGSFAAAVLTFFFSQPMRSSSQS